MLALHSSILLKYLPPASVFTFRNWMRIFTCLHFWKDSLAPRSGWLAEWVQPGVSPEVRRRPPRQREMAGWADARRRRCQQSLRSKGRRAGPGRSAHPHRGTDGVGPAERQAVLNAPKLHTHHSTGTPFRGTEEGFATLTPSRWKTCTYAHRSSGARYPAVRYAPWR
jgi:hypothetical protein